MTSEKIIQRCLRRMVGPEIFVLGKDRPTSHVADNCNFEIADPDNPSPHFTFSVGLVGTADGEGRGEACQPPRPCPTRRAAA